MSMPGKVPRHTPAGIDAHHQGLRASDIDDINGLQAGMPRQCPFVRIKDHLLGQPWQECQALWYGLANMHYMRCPQQNAGQASLKIVPMPLAFSTHLLVFRRQAYSTTPQ